MKKYLILILVLLGFGAVAFYFLGQRQKPAVVTQIEQPVQEVPVDVQLTEESEGAQEQAVTSRRNDKYFGQMQEGKLPEPTQPILPEVVEPAQVEEALIEEPKVAAQKEQPVQKKVEPKKVAKAKKKDTPNTTDAAGIKMPTEEEFKQRMEDMNQMVQKRMAEDPEFRVEMEKAQERMKTFELQVQNDPELSEINRKMEQDPESVTPEEAQKMFGNLFAALAPEGTEGE